MSSYKASSSLIEEWEELMVPTSYSGGPIERRIGHFLKPRAGSLEEEDSDLKLPRLSQKEEWPLNLNLRGWQVPMKAWEKWVDKMFPKYHFLWKEVGILDAILSSKYSFKKDYELILAVTERWCADTSTFVFPWGEASISLEDVMILGGLSVLGRPYFTPLEQKHLMGIETIMRREVDKFGVGRKKKHTHIRWINFFMLNNDNQFDYEHEAFLTSWLSRFVFPVDEIYMINDNVLPTAIRLARGTRIALAPPVLAGLYTNLSLLKETMTDSIKCHQHEGGHILQLDIFWSPFHLVQLWAWERFEPFRPNPNPLKPGEPRVARWNNVKKRTSLLINNGYVRNTIDFCGEVFQWRPYCLPLDNWIIPSFYVETKQRIEIGSPLLVFSSPNNNRREEMESFARCLRVCHLVGTEGEEVYQPHRVAMQFGYDQDLPGLVVSRPNLPRKDLTAWVEHEYYSKNINDSAMLYLPPRMAKPEVTIRYLNWWRRKVLCLLNNNSIRVSQLTRRRRSTRSRSRSITPYSHQVPKQKAAEVIEQETFTMIDLNLPPDDSLLLGSKRVNGQEGSTNSMIDLNLTPSQSPNIYY